MLAIDRAGQAKSSVFGRYRSIGCAWRIRRPHLRLRVPVRTHILFVNSDEIRVWWLSSPVHRFEIIVVCRKRAVQLAIRLRCYEGGWKLTPGHVGRGLPDAAARYLPCCPRVGINYRAIAVRTSRVLVHVSPDLDRYCPQYDVGLSSGHCTHAHATLRQDTSESGTY